MTVMWQKTYNTYTCIPVRHVTIQKHQWLCVNAQQEKQQNLKHIKDNVHKHDILYMYIMYNGEYAY